MRPTSPRWPSRHPISRRAPRSVGKLRGGPGLRRVVSAGEVSDGVGARIELAFRAGSTPVWQGNVTAITASDWLQWISYAPFPSGSYTCDASVDDRVVAQLPFTVF